MAADLSELDLSGWQDAHPSGRVPVLVFDEDGAKTKNKALLREIAENEKRRSYTAAEVKGLAERLKKAGFDDIKGRPEADQQSVRVELARILGRSSRQIRRLLNDPETAKPKGGHGVLLLARLRRQETSLTRLKKVLAKDEDGKAILAAADKLSEAIKAYLASKQSAE
jgi:ParB family chromosome partitioning protein